MIPRSTKPIARSPVPKKRKGKRRGPLRDPKYRAYIRKIPCLVCWPDFWLDVAVHISRGEFGWSPTFMPGTVQKTPTECAHVGKRGLGQKCSDYETLPLCAEHHRTGPESHHVLGKAFWAHHGLDKEVVIAELQRLYSLERKA